MDLHTNEKTRSAANLARKIRVDWAIRQYRKGFMDMEEAAFAARVPVMVFAGAVELDVPRLTKARALPN